MRKLDFARACKNHKNHKEQRHHHNHVYQIRIIGIKKNIAGKMNTRARQHMVSRGERERPINKGEREM